MDKDLQFSQKSMVDDFGRVFFSDNKVYRAINPNMESYCYTLINSELFIELTQKGLVPKTSIADFSIKNYKLILHHEKLLEVQQHEWSFSMLKDAALLILEINSICGKYGYELKDAHTLNILFRGTQPVLVDIGSIAIKKNIPWIALEEYIHSFIIPLLFWSENKIYITRKLLESNFHRMVTLPHQTIVESGLLNLLDKNIVQYKLKIWRYTLLSHKNRKNALIPLIKVINRGTKLLKKDSNLIKYDLEPNHSLFSFENIKEIVNNTIKPTTASQWQNYHTYYYSEKGVIEYSNRFKRLLDLIKNLENEINSIIDLAGNEGYFCRLLEKNTRINYIRLVDYDENAIDSAYNAFKKEGIQKISTVFLNFMFTIEPSSTAKRLKSDLAIALAVTHHLILTNHYDIYSILERVKSFSNKYVIIEFMPLGLWAIGSKEYPDIPSWYNVNWFRNCFETVFEIIVEEQLEENRIAFLGKIKKYTT